MTTVLLIVSYIAIGVVAFCVIEYFDGSHKEVAGGDHEDQE